MVDTINLDAEYRSSREGGQQYSAKRVSDCCTKSSFKRGQNKFSIVFRFYVFLNFKICAFKLLHATILLLKFY